MVIIIVILFIALITAFSRKRSSPFVYETLGKSARRLYTTVYGGGIEERPRVIPERETCIWVRSQSVKRLKQVRYYLRSEIGQLQPADWDGYMLNTILARSTDLLFFLDENGDLTIYAARNKELEGIQDAMNAVQHTPFHSPFTLRTFFHDIFHNIIACTRHDDRYYGFGQLKVINLLRSYQASIGLCMQRSIGSHDSELLKPGIFARLAMHFKWLQEQREANWIDINRGFPIIEFDLRRIDQEGMFEHDGSLLNCLFLHLVSHVSKVADIEPAYRSFSEPTYDMRAACFSYGCGEVYVVKYTGVTDEFPHRLYVEFANITPRDALYFDLLSKKLHLERNN
jgi:hypothetical protein